MGYYQPRLYRIVVCGIGGTALSTVVTLSCNPHSLLHYHDEYHHDDTPFLVFFLKMYIFQYFSSKTRLN